MKTDNIIKAADLFCGAGGTSQGLLMAANDMGAGLELVAVNHSNIAIETHSMNHAYAKHLCNGLDNVDPRKLVPGGHLHLLCASPECTHHSNARGGKPMSDQSRSSGFHILRFAEALYIDNILIENVSEWKNWGPLGRNGRPLKSKKGQLFEQFINSLKALGYKVEWRVLNCADYGDPTTRERLFIIARRGNKKIRWPEPTHIPPKMLANPGLFVEERKPWRTAREIIDWSIPSQSIFDRKKPLCNNTLRRIEAGLKRFCGIDLDLRRCFLEDLRPFLIVFRNNQDAISLDVPVPTLTTSGANFGLIQPFLLQSDQIGSNGACVFSQDAPVPTIVTKANMCMVQPFLVPNFTERDGQSPRIHSIDDPAPTVTSHGAGGLVTPFLVTVNHGESGGSRCHTVDAPLPTVTGSLGDALIQPFLIEYYGTLNMSSVDSPVPTATTKERFGLVEASVTRFRLDIRFRMLQPIELARAQGFPDTYRFSGRKKDVVKSIGNAVPPGTAKALIVELLRDFAATGPQVRNDIAA
jgi:DNA (cytosine-5)-methyltransferase 1